MIGKGLRKALRIFFIVNIILASIFFIFSLIGIFFNLTEPSIPTFWAEVLFILSRPPFYISLIPLVTFLMWNRLNSILVGVITILWIGYVIFIFLLILFSYKAINDPSYDVCSRISTGKDDCYMRRVVEEIASTTKYPSIENVNRIYSLCEKIQDANKKQNCFDIYYREKAQIEGDIAFCEQISTNQGKDGCFYWVTTQKIKNISLCDKITDEALRSGCSETVRRFG